MSSDIKLDVDSDGNQDIYHYHYEPRALSDVIVTVPLVDDDGRSTGKELHFHLHKAVLASASKWFSAVFETDISATHITMPNTFIFSNLHVDLFIQAERDDVVTFFDKIYRINSSISNNNYYSCWCLLLQALYTECSWLIQQCETDIINYLQDWDDMPILIGALVSSEHFHLEKLEAHVFTQLNKQSRQTLAQLNQSPLKEILACTTKAQLLRLLPVVMK